MSTLFGFKSSISGTILMGDPGSSKLFFDDNSFKHLLIYISLLENQPALEAGSPALIANLNALQQEAQNFGTPKQLRKLLTTQPNILSGEPASSLLYVQFLAVIQRTHQFASSLVSTAESLKTIDEPVDKEEIIKELLEPVLTPARFQTKNLVASLERFKSAMIKAKTALSDSFDADAEVLREMNESIGGLQYQVESLPNKIKDLGLLSRGKRKELETQLQSAQSELARSSDNAEKLRAALAPVERILNESNWLESGINGITDFLQKLDGIWKCFDPNEPQMVVVSLLGKTPPPTSEEVINLDDMIAQWSAIDKAAREFTTNALVDPE